MKLFFKTTAILALSVLIWTCSEDFLVTPPQGVLSASNLTAEQGIEAVLVSAYSRLDGYAGNGNGWGAAASNYAFASVASDDSHKGSQPGDQDDQILLERFQWRANNPLFLDKFTAVYDGVRRANETLTLLAANESLGETDRNRIMGEALFLRAHYHMEAWKLWKRVPYFDEMEENLRKPNDQDIYPLIVQDFEEAASLLPANQAQIGRATSGAANALLGRLHMLNGDLGSAETAFNKVTGYSLNDCFHDMFSQVGENGPEMIFSVQSSINDGDPNGANANHLERLAMPHAGSPYGCCGVNQPTQSLVNAYLVTDNGLPLRENTLNSNPTPDMPVDPRLDWTVGRDGVPYLNQGNHESDWIRDPLLGGPYSPKKFSFAEGEASNVGWSPNLSGVNIPIIRYADVLLYQAEIDVNAGRLEDARAKVNMIRERAGNCAQGAEEIAVPIDSDQITWADYRVSPYPGPWTDAVAAREAVRLERRLEFALEGRRLFDLQRYGLIDNSDYFIQTMTNYLQVERTRRPHLETANLPTATNLRFPLPSTAILRSRIDGVPTLQQNPGY
ncbi:putative outer membrane starch-binding protein [Neolewinella xylanilytica]|uniref:Putative outer membrane starch-binding protein n=1 Tax=Neolewinella xylanilytica TaxID=1514080 RepID=A0A2S6I230_9BACT|nr:RagB/SusD family nutrient uptake outer membrane protein [Neolewinella xylanilytica]PPK85232.1 putative outer membrane starch-binding protein [Neolewinella xylanilytica]